MKKLISPTGLLSQIQTVNDVIAISDTPGLDSYRFVNTSSAIVFQFASGREVIMNKNEGALSVETFRWFAREEFGLDYSPYSADFKIVIDADEILDTSTMFAGTDESETIILPSLVDGAIDSGYGWSEIYLNGGNDILTLSKDINFIVHMGAGDDKVYAQETQLMGHMLT